jgi:hypothetical protein
VRPRTKNLHLPPNVHEKHGAYYYVKYGKWHYVGKDISLLASVVSTIPQRHNQKFYGVERYIRDIVWPRAKSNATGRRSIPFSLTQDEAVGLCRDAGWRCAVSGTPFSLIEVGHKNQKPYAPSIDRVDSRQGYDRGNCRIVCVAVNFALNCWGEDVFHTITNYRKRRIQTEY